MTLPKLAEKYLREYGEQGRKYSSKDIAFIEEYVSDKFTFPDIIAIKGSTKSRAKNCYNALLEDIFLRKLRMGQKIGEEGEEEGMRGGNTVRKKIWLEFT